MIGVFFLEAKANYSPSIAGGIYCGKPTIKNLLVQVGLEGLFLKQSIQGHHQDKT